MSCSYPFPGLEKLRRQLAVRGWTRELLAHRAGIAVRTAERAVAGKPVAVETIERISAALVAYPPQTATAAFLRGAEASEQIGEEGGNAG